MKTQTNWLDAAAVMQMLRISRPTLNRWRRLGLLTAHRPPGSNRLYFSQEEVDTLLKSHAVQENHHLDTTAFQKP